MKSSVFLISNQLWFSSLNLYGSWNNQDYQIWFAAEPAVYLALLWFLTFLSHWEQTKTVEVQGRCALFLQFTLIQSHWKLSGFFNSFQQIFKGHLFDLKRHERQECRETRETGSFFTSRLLTYNRHQLKAYRSFFGRTVSCKKIPLSRLTRLSLFCQNYIEV